jgi:hypothetical protein
MNRPENVTKGWTGAKNLPQGIGGGSKMTVSRPGLLGSLCSSAIRTVATPADFTAHALRFLSRAIPDATGLSPGKFLVPAIGLGLCAATTAVAQTAPLPRVTYILAGHVLDKPGEPMLGATTIVVRGDKVSEVRPGFNAPTDGSQIIDIRDGYVLPGLIDMHVHLWGIAGDPVRQQAEQLSRDRVDDMVEAQKTHGSI